MKISLLSQGILVGACCAVLAGCGNSNTGSSQLSLAVTDAPVDEAAAVVVRFNGVTIHGKGNNNLQFIFCDGELTASDAACANPTTREIDLLKLTGTNSTPLITDAVIPAGNYQWMRLDLDDTRPGYIVPSAGGGEYDLTIPSGAQTGLKLNNEFSAPDGGMVSFTVDFNLRKSVHMTGTGDYIMRPTLRLLANTNVGSIYGTVDATLINPSTCVPAVYLYQNADTTPDDEGGSGANPVTWAIVSQDGTSGDYAYEIGFVEAGDYTLAFTCEADLDQPGTDDDISFAVVQNTSVSANNSTEANIP
jgi:hypothetical protein